MKDFADVYILESLSPNGHFYVGLTDNLVAPLAKHNAGAVPHTADSSGRFRVSKKYSARSLKKAARCFWNR